MLICSRQELKLRLGPKFSSWLCSIDHVSYALPFFLPTREFPAGIKRGDFWQMWKTVGCSGEILCFYFLALGLRGGGKKHSQIHMPSPPAFLFRVEFGKVLPWIHLYSGHFSTPTSPPRCSPEGRKGGGGMPVTAASRHSWLWFICKATEEAGEFPEAPSSRVSWYQHLAKASLTRSSLLFFHCPLRDSD